MSSFDLKVAKESNELYIDDISAGMPIHRNITLEHGMMVDWVVLEKKLEEAELSEGI